VGEQLETWRVPAVPSSVPELRRLLLSRIGGRGFDTASVSLAVTEAITNVVRHAYPQADGPVTLSAEASGDELVVVIQDEGNWSDADAARSNDPGMGIGLALIRELSSSVRFQPTMTGTTITIRFAKV
jgi:anti-sigma regulatory factor (Ser/Thr protein kinase)